MPPAAHSDHIDGPDPIGADGRRERAVRRIPSGAVCVACGENDPVALKKASRSILELHHIAGRTNDPNLVHVACLNCHRKDTNRQRDAGIPLAVDEDRSLLAKLVAWLRGLAVFFEHLARELIGMAHRIEALEGSFDQQQPGWRDLPEAK